MPIAVDPNDPDQLLLSLPEGGYELAWADELEDAPAGARRVPAFAEEDAADLLQAATWLRLSAMWMSAASSFELVIQREGKGALVTLTPLSTGEPTRARMGLGQTGTFLQDLGQAGVGRLCGIYYPAGQDPADDAGFWRLDYTDGLRWRHAEGTAAWPDELGSLCSALSGVGLPNLFRGGQLALPEE